MRILTGLVFALFLATSAFSQSASPFDKQAGKMDAMSDPLKDGQMVENEFTNLILEGQLTVRAIEFGDDTSEWANDGECDDPRFVGTGVSANLSIADVMRDASDCRAMVEAGYVSFHPKEPVAFPLDTFDLPTVIPENSPARGVEIMFATNRQHKAGGSMVQFTGARASGLTLGRMVVSIPLDHRRGEIERPWVQNLMLITIGESEDPTKHFMITSLGLESEASFLSSIDNKQGEDFDAQALIYIHGFANTFEDGSFRLAQMAFDMNFDGVPILYSWPSMGPLASYVSDRETSEASAEHFTAFLRMLLNDTGLKKIHLICHSMGCNSAIRALDALEDKEPDDIYATTDLGAPVAISEILFAAPDVDTEIFQQFAGNLVSLGMQMTLYASGNDKALLASQSLVYQYPRAGFIPANGEPVILQGLETIDISALGLDWIDPEHSDFADELVIMGDIRQLLQSSIRPPDDRTAAFTEMADDTGRVFWKF